MFSGVFKFADVPVMVNSIYMTVQSQCHDFRTELEPKFTVTVTQEMINLERGDENYSDDYLETLAVYRQITEKLIDENVVLIHASSLAVDEAGYMFCAKSGTGKSTHSALWKKHLGEKAVMINDDKPLVRINDNNAIIYGTAWKGKHNIGSNVSFPLKAICFLERGNNNFIEEMTLENAFPKLVCHVYQKKDEQYMIKMLKLLDKLKYVRFYSLKCNMDLQAAVVAYEKMRECNET